MSRGKVLAGIDAGHVETKAVVMVGGEVLGFGTAATRFSVIAAARTALERALGEAGTPREGLAGVVATGIFREVLRGSPLGVVATVPEYVADAKGAFSLNRNSRTVIDLGGNIHKAVAYDGKGDLLDVIQNDKCADGLGIFYTTMAGALGLSEEEMSELALKSTGDGSIAIHCALSAESDAIDLLCRGVALADVAKAVSMFLIDRVAAMCASMTLSREVVVAGGLARSEALVKGLSRFMNRDVTVVSPPEYVGALGAVIAYEGGR